jgi:succinyl-CoA synthetase alpha subunit
VSSIYGSEFLNKKTGVVVFGATGREASQVIKESEALYPGLIKAGIAPGKAGQDLLPVPLYNSLGDAQEDKKIKGNINTALIYVPPGSVFDAAMEAMEHGVKLIYIITEHVPIKFTTLMRYYAEQHGARVVGPSSLGCFAPGIGRIGAIGGKDPSFVFKPGSMVILSKSGGMTVTTAEMFRRRGWGVYFALALGGDVISCTTYSDVLPVLEKYDAVRSVVLLGEPGGTYEEEAAKCVEDGLYTKPLVCYIAGKFQENILQDVTFGHAGAIVERGQGKSSQKIARLREAGKKRGMVKVVDYYHELVEAMESLNVPRDFADESGGKVKPLYNTMKTGAKSDG